MPLADGEPARFSSDLRVEGVVSGNVDLQIDGRVRGEVRGRVVSIGRRGDVEASVKAHVVEIAGELYGRIEAMTVNIADGARVDATIFHYELNVEKGAVVKGLRPWRPASDIEQRREFW